MVDKINSGMHTFKVSEDDDMIFETNLSQSNSKPTRGLDNHELSVLSEKFSCASSQEVSNFNFDGEKVEMCPFQPVDTLVLTPSSNLPAELESNMSISFTA